MTASTLRVGTAGWSVAAQYNGDVPTGGSHLERYARRLNAVEINSSFYRPHQRKTYERWAQSTPRGFRFSLKVPKAMTHEYSLADCGALLDRFAADVTGLGVKLAVLLVQLPPNLALEKRVAGGFFRSLRKRIDVPIACEPRHASWFTPDTNDWLAGRGSHELPPIPRRYLKAANPADGPDLPIIAGMDRHGSITLITTRRRLRRSAGVSPHTASVAFRPGAFLTIPLQVRRLGTRSR